MKRFLFPSVAAGAMSLLLALGAGCGAGTYPPADSSIYVTQALANIQAQSAQRTAEAVNLAVAAQETAVARQTVAAREQWAFEQTQTAVAATAQAMWAQATAAVAQATRASEAQATQESLVAAQATATVQAAVAATAAFRVEQTAVAAPTATLVAAQTRAQAERLEWERKTAPILHILRVTTLILLAAISLTTLLWLIPRAWHALMVRFLAFRTGGPDMPLVMAVVNPGFLRAWRDAPRLTAYNADRDGGPGQTIDLSDGAAATLPGGNADVTRRDQAVDALARPIAAAAQNGRSARPGQATRAAQRMLQPPPYLLLPAADTPPPQIAAAVESLDAQWEEVSDGHVN